MPRDQWSDEELLDIVKEIDSTVESVYDGDVEFIESILERNVPRFSEAQRSWIMDMHDRYLAW